MTTRALKSKLSFRLNLKMGLQSRLRLISLFPIIILFSLATYYVYTTFASYQNAQVLQTKLEENKILNQLIGALSRERGMTVMYLGNSSEATFNSLQAQRTIVNQQFNEYSNFVKNASDDHNHNNTTKICKSCKILQDTLSFHKEIKDARIKVDAVELEFEEIYYTIYGNAQTSLMQRLSEVTNIKVDKHITSLITSYLAMTRAKEFTGAERDYISYALARSTSLDSDELNTWINLIGKADAINYHALDNNEVRSHLDTLFKNEDNVELFEDIIIDRSESMQAINDGLYSTEAGIWFAMLSEKIAVLDQAESILIAAIDNRIITVQNHAVTLFFISVAIWIFSILLALLAMLLSNDIAHNIRSLEDVLRHVAQDAMSDAEDNFKCDINLDTPAGTAKAYALLEKLINEANEDKDSAVRANEAKSMFLANMSHEIRTPLNGIVGFTELLKDTEVNDEQYEFIEVIQKSSANLLELISNILDLSKIESNKIELETIEFDPIEEFSSAVEVYAVRAAEKHINLGCYIDPSLEQKLIGDPTKLKEVIVNLLSNAVKFTDNNGSINIDIRQVPSDEMGKVKIVFQVQDSGIGVSSEQKSTIFQAFSQADTSITRKFGGTGLGLTISSRFVELMGGQLDLESQPGSGTTFFFAIEFDMVEKIYDSSRNIFKHLNVAILKNDKKTKRQESYLIDYFNYFGVTFTLFSHPSEFANLSHHVDYDFLIVDYDYTNDQALIEYDKLSDKLILICKSYYMRHIDHLGLHTYKVLYEPINSTKLLNTLKITDKKLNNKPQVEKKNSMAFNAKILVAEDNMINQKLIKRTLEDMGLTVVLADNGLEALSRRMHEEFDLIFMDIQMPVLDGTESALAIVEYEKEMNIQHIPTIALTANALKGDREEFLKMGLDEYTTKPIVRDNILKMLNRFLSDKCKITKDESTKKSVEVTKKSEVKTIKAKIVEPKEPTVKQEILQEKVKAQKAPKIDFEIALVKKGKIETKIFAHLLKQLELSHEIFETQALLEAALVSKNYKTILIDYSIEDLNVVTLKNQLKVGGIMIMSDKEVSDNDKASAQKVLSNIVTKELLEQTFK
jgi:signal transduction histidine kinase/CheY-like chemotaxis protein